MALCRIKTTEQLRKYSPGEFGNLLGLDRVPEVRCLRGTTADVEVSMPNGELVTIALAEQGSLVGSGKKKVWVREIRKLTDSGHQTSLISTAYDLPHDGLAARMFSLMVSCQENFFRYMMRHYAIDLIVEYGADDFPDTE